MKALLKKKGDMIKISLRLGVELPGILKILKQNASTSQFLALFHGSIQKNYTRSTHFTKTLSCHVPI